MIIYVMLATGIWFIDHEVAKPNNHLLDYNSSPIP